MRARGTGIGKPEGSFVISVLLPSVRDTAEPQAVQNNRVSPKIGPENGQTRLLYTLSALYHDRLAKISVQ